MNDYVPHNLPTLSEVLHRPISGPVSLANLRVFMLQNNCIEILNFLEEAKGYRESYCAICVQLGPISHHSIQRPEVQELLILWRHLVLTYILPGSSRGIDITNHERDQFAAVSSMVIPPSPNILDSPVRRLEQLLADAIFPAFLSNQCENMFVRGRTLMF